MARKSGEKALQEKFMKKISSISEDASCKSCVFVEEDFGCNHKYRIQQPNNRKCCPFWTAHFPVETK